MFCSYVAPERGADHIADEPAFDRFRRAPYIVLTPCRIIFAYPSDRLSGNQRGIIGTRRCAMKSGLFVMALVIAGSGSSDAGNSADPLSPGSDNDH